MSIETIVIDKKYKASYTVTKSIHLGFLQHFQDRNPIHLSKKVSTDSGYKDKLSYGAVLNGFLSHFLGSQVSSGGVVCLSVNINYHHPVYIGDELKLIAQVTQVSQSTNLVSLSFEFQGNNNEVVSSGDSLIKVL